MTEVSENGVHAAGAEVTKFGKPHIHALPVYEPHIQSGHHSRHCSNENPLGPSPRVIEALRDTAARVHEYPDAKSVRLRGKLSERLGVTPDMISCTNGSDEMIGLLCQGLVGAGESVVMSAGSFVTFAVRSSAVEAEVIKVPLRDYHHDTAAMIGAVHANTRLLFVCSPNNPTGTVNTGSELVALLQRTPAHVTVVVDEAYAEFADDRAAPALMAELRGGRRNLIVLRTFAKAYGLAGLRIGYAIGHASVLAYIEKLRPIFSVNALAQAAALAALEDHEHLAASVGHAQRCRRELHALLTALGLAPIESQANFLCVHVGDDKAYARYLSGHGFSVTPLSAWGLPGHIRLSFGSDRQNEALIEALKARPASIAQRA